MGRAANGGACSMVMGCSVAITATDHGICDSLRNQPHATHASLQRIPTQRLQCGLARGGCVIQAHGVCHAPFPPGGGESTRDCLPNSGA